ncbi:hypothetical protein CY34DRAFT_802818 [Suillus luteus UH-Slu-Lm8-n1]|uniref:Uncharacterized protein n=1 Tax=Suillus luteus UH-Slu-Lm8-n1 TaxID=930992 RepID=A0A0D0ARE1_9AGAM|nr:hypothetical protein CY34DRAFT_802818 [Suillus luteus UH-Slu-Lm8-n1]
MTFICAPFISYRHSASDRDSSSSCHDTREEGSEPSIDGGSDLKCHVDDDTNTNGDVRERCPRRSIPQTPIRAKRKLKQNPQWRTDHEQERSGMTPSLARRGQRT